MAAMVGDVLTPASQQHPCDGAATASGQVTLLRGWCFPWFSLWKYWKYCAGQLLPPQQVHA